MKSSQTYSSFSGSDLAASSSLFSRIPLFRPVGGVCLVLQFQLKGIVFSKFIDDAYIEFFAMGA